MEYFDNPKRLYKFWNSRYFGGRLPDIPVVFSKKEYSKRSRRHILGAAWLHGETKKPIKITLNPDFRTYRALWQHTLLHEMVHVQQWRVPAEQSHGNKFNKRMKQLAAQGAFRHIW